MDAADRRILVAMLASELDGSRPVRTDGPPDMQDRLDRHVRDGLVLPDRTALTDRGRGCLRVVFAGGVFDIIHPGHIHTLNAARRLGDMLVVVVATDSTVRRMKKRSPLHTQGQRRDLVGSLSVVDACLVGDEDDIFSTVRRVRPQVIALGYDQAHQEGFITEGCRRIGLDATVARLQSPMPETSSSDIAEKYGRSIHET